MSENTAKKIVLNKEKLAKVTGGRGKQLCCPQCGSPDVLVYKDDSSVYYCNYCMCWFKLDGTILRNGYFS